MSDQMRRRRIPLRVKLIVASFVPTAIILGAVAAVILFAFQQVTEELAVERDREVTRLMANQLATELDAYERPISTLALRLSTLSSTSERMQALAETDSANMGFDGGLFLLDDEGQVIAEFGNDEQSAWTYLGMKLYDDPCLGEWTQYSVVRRAEGQGQEYVAIAANIIDAQGTCLGMVAGVLPLRNGSLGGVYGQARADLVDRLEQDPLYWQAHDSAADQGEALPYILQRIGFAQYSASSVANAFLIDQQGYVIQGTGADLIGQRVSAQAADALVALQRVDAMRTQDERGRSVLVSYAPVGVTGWGILVLEDWDVVYGPADRFVRYLILLLVASVVIPALIVTLAFRQLTRPVEQLIAAARDIGNGTFRVVHIDTNDERADLGRHFNMMSERLQASYQLLEQRVAERTADLELLLRISREVGRKLDTRYVLTTGLDALIEFVGATGGLACATPYDGETTVLVRGTVGDLPDDPIEVCRALDCEGPSLREACCVPGRMLLVVPLNAAEVLHAILVVWVPQGWDRLGEQGDLLASIGQQISAALGNALLHEQASHMAVVTERRRLARDLHDSVSQALYGVTYYARAADRLLDAGRLADAHQHLYNVQESARQALAEMRLLIYHLRPSDLEELGLNEALQKRLDSVEARTGLETVFTSNLSERLEDQLEETLYLVALEGLNNVVRHALASRVRVSLRSEGQSIRLEISDDGKGFVPDRPHPGGVGLENIRARVSTAGGKVTLESAPGRGTTVRVEVPL